MVPNIQTEIRIFAEARERFAWAVRVSTDNPKDSGLVAAGLASGYVTARFEANLFCQRLARAALRPLLNGERLELKQEKSGANLSRGRTA